MLAFLKTILYVPLFNALIGLVNIIPGHDFGVAIIVLTVIIRLILFPLSLKAQRSQRELNLLGPKIKELKEKYKNDQAAQGQAMMKLYKEHGVNPVAGCLPLLIQLPLLIALYRVFIDGLNPNTLSLLYPFVHNPGSISPTFIYLINTATKNPWLAVLAAVLTYLQARQSMANMGNSATGNPQLAAMNTQMLYFMPIFILIIGWNLPAGLILYWITTTAFSIGEQTYIKRTL